MCCPEGMTQTLRNGVKPQIKIAEILNTEGLGSRIPQQEWQRDENPEMEFSYSVAVSCSKNVASLVLPKFVR